MTQKSANTFVVFHWVGDRIRHLTFPFTMYRPVLCLAKIPSGRKPALFSAWRSIGRSDFSLQQCRAKVPGVQHGDAEPIREAISATPGATIPALWAESFWSQDAYKMGFGIPIDAPVRIGQSRAG